MPRTSRLVAAALAATLLAGACGSSDDSSDADPTTTAAADGPTSTAGASAVTATFEKGRCPDQDYFSRADAEDEGAMCGTVAVPEDYDDPDGAQVELTVMVLPATDDDPEPDPIVYLDGGPGGDGLGSAAEFASSSWRETRDIILYSQRGTPYSDPSLNCDASDAALEQFLPLEPDSDEAEELGDELFEQCRDDLLDEGIDLQQYNSANSARDLQLLRQALGETFDFDEWNLLGISYGTRLALTVLRDDAEGTRSVVIDSVYPLTRDLGVEVGVNAQKAFDTLFERCEADLSCATRYPDLAARWEALVAEVEADPVVLEVESVTSDLGGEVLIDGDTLVGGLFQLLYVDSLIPDLPSLIEAMEDGDFDLFAQYLLAIAEGNAAGIAEGMYTSVQCQEEIPFSSEELAAEATEGLPEVTARVFDPTGDAEDCETWGVDPSDPIENEPVSSDVPTLVMSGAFDPITPESWAAEAAATLGNYWFVVIEDGGHGSSLSACGADIVQRFLDDPKSVPTLPCAEESRAIRWS